jgi:hypothetical protein
MDILPYTKSRGPLSLTILKPAPIDQHGHAVGGWAHRRLCNSRFYWKPDLQEMGKTLAELEADRDVGKLGAQKRLESFREQRMLLVDSIVQVGVPFRRFHSYVCSCWNNSELRRVGEVGQG